jgi:hypothetical protein
LRENRRQGRQMDLENVIWAGMSAHFSRSLIVEENAGHA